MGKYQDIVILTGAGISAESGLKTFRDAGGLWEGHDVYSVATPEGYAANPDLVQRFYSERRLQLREAFPNAAHKALGRLASEFQGRFTLVTQNVDDLHERGGVKDTIHMHGELKRVRCRSCTNVHDWDGVCTEQDTCPACGYPTLRPNIVWFGEMPFHMELIYDRLAACDLFISIGTSGQVYPAAGFVAEVRAHGRAHTIELNLEPSDGASQFSETRYGHAGELVPALVSEILGE